MGFHYAFLCPACGYRNHRCCGGTEYGRSVALSTVHCVTCAALFDVPSCRYGYTIESVVANCPLDADHVVAEWIQPGPCPKCGAALLQQGISAVWD